MDTQKRFKPNLILLTLTLAVSLLAACAPTPTPTLFVPPKAPSPTQPLLQGQQPVIPTFTPQPTPFASPTPTPPCTDNLTFLEDLTVEDNTVVSPGMSIDKQWLVENSGSCNWDSRYRLKWVGADLLGANPEQALYPARAGAQITLRITFTAPSVPGTYASAWQAAAPDGTVFGDAFLLRIIVQ